MKSLVRLFEEGEHETSLARRTATLKRAHRRVVVQSANETTHEFDDSQSSNIFVLILRKIVEIDGSLHLPAPSSSSSLTVTDKEQRSIALRSRRRRSNGKRAIRISFEAGKERQKRASSIRAISLIEISSERSEGTSDEKPRGCWPKVRVKSESKERRRSWERGDRESLPRVREVSVSD